MLNRCKSPTKDGGPCLAQPVRPSGYCYWHDPALDAERQANRRRGGQERSNVNRAAKRVPRDMAAVKHALLEAMGKVAAGEMDPAPANALANLARAVVAVAGVADFETQLADMRSELARLAEREGA